MSELNYNPEIKEEPKPATTANVVDVRDEENDPLCCSCPPDPDTGVIKCPTGGG